VVAAPPGGHSQAPFRKSRQWSIPMRIRNTPKTTTDTVHQQCLCRPFNSV
jgi:hypothetical protein